MRNQARKGSDLEIEVSVFVLDKTGKPLMPCTEKRARLLLERGRARVHRVLPIAFIIASFE